MILALLEAALTAVDPETAVRNALRREGHFLHAGGTRIDLAALERLELIALGKAAPAMGRAAWEVLDGTDRSMLVISDHPEHVPEGVSLLIAGHPIPNGQSVEAATLALDLADQAGPNDLVICLISGGGSALAEIPAWGLELDDIRATAHLMLAGGVPIEEINTVRHHLSAFKGGRLAEAASPARLLTLVLSDVAGNPLPSIASGPTVADPSTFADAVAVLARHDLLDRVPHVVRAHLEGGAAGLIPETPKATVDNQTTIVVADNEVAADAACRTARSTGLAASVATTSLAGEARQAAAKCLEHAGDGITIFAGETTVTVRGEGRGGRNQEAALAAAVTIEGDPDIVFATFATDGVDGPTDAAGAIVDGRTIKRGRSRGFDPLDHLDRNDSHRFLTAAGELLHTGPTGTNVGDVWIVWRT